jgi:gamma-glutamylcyclotransferase (GGCT)/AIG2-like uncharacterized protein YtfP
MTHKLFVYGSLLSGLHNHHQLRDSRLLGSGLTYDRFTMYDLESFPCLVRDEHGEYAHGEVYEVDDDVLERLDQLEGVPSFYQRETVTVTVRPRLIGGEYRSMTTFVYVMDGESLPQHHLIVESGDWRTYARGRSHYRE